MKRLSKRDSLFVEEFLKTFNASEAARRIGLKTRANTAGARMMSKDVIRAEIERRIAESAMGADEVLHRLADQARGSLEDFLRFLPVDDKGNIIEPGEGNAPMPKPAEFVPVIDLDKAREAGKLHLLHGLKRTKYGWEIELYDAQSALEKLGRHHRLFTELVEHRGKDGAELFPIADLVKALHQAAETMDDDQE